MIAVEVLATGSKGNCYLLTSGETRILLDCGLAYKKTLNLLDFKLPTAVLVTHEHKDHAQAAKDFIKHGVDVYMTTGTAMALGLETNHRLHLIETEKDFKVGECVACAIGSYHDAADSVDYAVQDCDDVIYYITDEGDISYQWSYVKTPTKILLEINYSEEVLKNSAIDKEQKERISQFHLSAEKAFDFLVETDKSKLKEVFLIHISARHGDGETFIKVIQEIVGDKVKVIVAKNKE